MPWRLRAARLLLALALCALFAFEAADAASREAKADVKRPSLSLKASPLISFAPARIFLTAELRGGPNDYADYYCPTVEWDWGDGTRSEATADCEPYEAGKSEIKRRFVTEHVYRLAGNFRVQIRLKRKDKALVAASATVQVRPGLSSIGFYHQSGIHQNAADTTAP